MRELKEAREAKGVWREVKSEPDPRTYSDQFQMVWKNIACLHDSDGFEMFTQMHFLCSKPCQKL